jgi:hypothetical protein
MPSMKLRILKYWNDPDDGACSGPVEVLEWNSTREDGPPGVAIVRHEGDPIECEFKVFLDELSEGPESLRTVRRIIEDPDPPRCSACGGLWPCRDAGGFHMSYGELRALVERQDGND